MGAYKWTIIASSGLRSTIMWSHQHVPKTWYPHTITGFQLELTMKGLSAKPIVATYVVEIRPRKDTFQCFPPFTGHGFQLNVISNFKPVAQGSTCQRHLDQIECCMCVIASIIHSNVAPEVGQQGKVIFVVDSPSCIVDRANLWSHSLSSPTCVQMV